MNSSPVPEMSSRRTGTESIHQLQLDNKLWLTAGLAGGLAVGIFAYTHRPGVPVASVQSFQVDASEVDGRIRLTWNPDLSQIRAATGGTLDVRDGDKFHTFPIEGKVLQQGHFDYIRTTDDVLLSVRLLDNGKLGLQSLIRVVAPVVAVAPRSPAAPQKLMHQPAHSGVRSRKAAKPKKPAKSSRHSSSVTHH